MHSGGDWTEEEISTFRRRERRLIKEGLSEVEAEKLAELLVYRDRPDSGDDRRICLECRHVPKRGACPVSPDIQAPALRTVLMRCDNFQKVG